MATSDAGVLVEDRPRRVVSVDVYRGLVMLLLVLLDGPRFDWWEKIAADATTPAWARSLALQFEHIEWAGLRLWDMIQPSFMFLVGTSLAFSTARRQVEQSPLTMWGHAIYRAVVLVLLGVFLRSLGHSETQWRFDDVVSQIGLGYLPLFALRNASPRPLLAAAAATLLGYWLLFALWPLPPADYDWAAVEGRAYYEGLAAHWNKNADPALYFDQWLLNKFPRSEPFVANGGAYHTLNFVPSMATMILGLVAGKELLRRREPERRPLLRLAMLGAACLALGAALHFAGVCPCVKRIWTPSFTLVSGGLACLFLALLSWCLDGRPAMEPWTTPVIVVGRNPIAAYVMVHTIKEPLLAILHCHLGPDWFQRRFGIYAPLLENLVVGACIWAACWWLMRRRLLIRL